MNENVKLCLYCQKEVSHDAIKCPYCREWLNKTKLSFRNPWIQSILFMIIPLTIYYFAQANLKKISIPVSSYETYKKTSKLFITKHKMVKTKKSFSVIGEIENKEDFKWESVEVVAVFTDKKNEAFALGTAYVHNLEPHSSNVFEARIGGGCRDEEYDPNLYNTYTIHVESARGEWSRVAK